MSNLEMFVAKLIPIVNRIKLIFHYTWLVPLLTFLVISPGCGSIFIYQQVETKLLTEGWQFETTNLVSIFAGCLHFLLTCSILLYIIFT